MINFVKGFFILIYTESYFSIKGIKMVIDNLKDALDVLIQSAVIGQQRGIYTLREASLIQSSIEYLQFLSGENITEENVDGDLVINDESE